MAGSQRHGVLQNRRVHSDLTDEVFLILPKRSKDVPNPLVDFKASHRRGQLFSRGSILLNAPIHFVNRLGDLMQP